MPIAIVTGAGGLIGSESAQRFVEQGFDVLGIDNDMRAYFFGAGASTARALSDLESKLDGFTAVRLDIRDRDAIDKLLQRHSRAIEIVIHCAAQPSHDWAAREPHTDFEINALGTLNLLESTRRHCPDATFIFMSTNKVYGNRPNTLPMCELPTRWELPEDHQWFSGVPITCPIDQSTHSIFGASKLAADIMVQEYGRYFGMPTVCFRGGCLTGPQHAGAQMHGFLSYLMKCIVSGDPYTIFGYAGKQVRDNIHAVDVVSAFQEFHKHPKCAAVYNLGGGRASNVSMLEAIDKGERITGRKLDFTLSPDARTGDHQWYVSDLSAFKSDYPQWSMTYGIDDVLQTIYEQNVEYWTASSSAAKPES